MPALLSWSSSSAPRFASSIGTHPPRVRWGAVGVIVDVEEQPAPNSGTDYWVRARFGDFITRWIEA
jgi:hypothetical protein